MGPCRRYSRAGGVVRLTTIVGDAVDFGDGYQYLIVMLWTDAVDPDSGDFQAADSVHIFLPQVPGDLSGDQAVDATDIDLLLPQVLSGHNDPAYDLTGDGQVDQADADEMVHGILATEYGDVNLDGQVGLDDLNAVLNGFGVGPVGWAGGSMDGDSVVDLDDLNTVLNNFGFTSAASVTVVSAQDVSVVSTEADAVAPSTQTFALAESGRKGDKYIYSPVPDVSRPEVVPINGANVLIPFSASPTAPGDMSHPPMVVDSGVAARHRASAPSARLATPGAMIAPARPDSVLAEADALELVLDPLVL